MLKNGIFSAQLYKAILLHKKEELADKEKKLSKDF